MNAKNNSQADLNTIKGEIVGADNDTLKTLSDQMDSILSEAEESTEEATEIAHHFHNIERWFGKKAVPNAEISVMDNVLTPFQIDSANNAYGTGVCIIGSGDTPVQIGKVLFDLHELLITAVERTNEVYKIRIAWGSTTEADAITAGRYSTRMIYPTANMRTVPFEFMMPRIAVGTKVWANCWCANNTGTVDFYLGLHEYNE